MLQLRKLKNGNKQWWGSQWNRQVATNIHLDHMAIFSPLVLPPALTNLPQGYGQRLPLFDSTMEVSAQQYVVKIIGFIELEEIDNDDAKMHVITQSFS